MRSHPGGCLFRAERVFQTNGVRLWLLHASGRWVGAGPDPATIAQPVSFDMQPFDELASSRNDTPPTIELDQEAKQSLMDELWLAGVRPTGREDPNSVIQAKNEHLADLRKVIFEGQAK